VSPPVLHGLPAVLVPCPVLRPSRTSAACWKWQTVANLAGAWKCDAALVPAVISMHSWPDFAMRLCGFPAPYACPCQNCCTGLFELQGVTETPFRVVDEINQGMDQVNERKVFIQLVESSCKPDTPQCFLLTPKLVGGLPFTPEITVSDTGGIVQHLDACNMRHACPMQRY
jgi:hypothetical protein